MSLINNFQIRLAFVCLFLLVGKFKNISFVKLWLQFVLELISTIRPCDALYFFLHEIHLVIQRRPLLADYYYYFFIITIVATLKPAIFCFELKLLVLFQIKKKKEKKAKPREKDEHF